MIWWILVPIPLAPILLFSCAKKKKPADEPTTTHDEPELRIWRSSALDARTEVPEQSEQTQRPEETDINRALDMGLVLPTIREQTLLQRTMQGGTTRRGPETVMTNRTNIGSMATVMEPMTLALEPVPDYGRGGFGTTRDPTMRTRTLTQAPPPESTMRTRTQTQAPPPEPPATRRWSQQMQQTQQPQQTQSRAAQPEPPPATRRWSQQTQGPSRWAPKTQPVPPSSQAPRGRTFAQPPPSRFQPPEPSVRPPAPLNVKPAKDPQKVSPAESDYATLPNEPHMMPEISNL